VEILFGIFLLRKKPLAVIPRPHYRSDFLTAIKTPLRYTPLRPHLSARRFAPEEKFGEINPSDLLLLIAISG